MADHSSDETIHDVQPQQRAPKGLAAIEEICADPRKLRRDTKATWKSLEFGAGAPGTVELMQRAQDRFNLLRARMLAPGDTEALKQPPSTETIVRIMAAMAESITPRIIGKSALSLSTLITMFRYSIASLKFEHSSWRPEPGLAVRFHTLCSQLQREGKIINGRYLQRAWHGVATLSIIIRRTLDSNLKLPPKNWDLVILDILTLVLISALAARAGDITRSQGYYGGEFLHWSDVTIFLQSDKPAKLEHLTMVVDNRMRKGHKLELNGDERDPRVLHANTEEHLRHLCPVLWIVI